MIYTYTVIGITININLWFWNKPWLDIYGTTMTGVISEKWINLAIGLLIGVKICTWVWYLVNENIDCLFICGTRKIQVNSSTQIWCCTITWIYMNNIVGKKINMNLDFWNVLWLDINITTTKSVFYKLQTNKYGYWIQTWDWNSY